MLKLHSGYPRDHTPITCQIDARGGTNHDREFCFRYDQELINRFMRELAAVVQKMKFHFRLLTRLHAENKKTTQYRANSLALQMFFLSVFHKMQIKKSTSKDKVREKQKNKSNREREKLTLHGLFDLTEVCW